jgi:hypothetical protein
LIGQIDQKKMQWKFWQRWGKGNHKDEARSQQKDSSALSSLLSQSSAQEILGLQRLVGNQAVLRILAPEKVDASASRVNA